jgi:hypothetical protein
MTKHYFNLRSAAAMLAVSVLTLTAQASFANKNKFDSKTNIKAAPSVTFVRADDYTSSFLVNVSADDSVKFLLTIKDKAGVVLYSQVIESANFSKTFKIANDELNNGDLTFSVKTLANGEVSTFKVKTEEKTINEILVTKNK